MADSTTSSLNLSTESIQVAAEDAREVQITNQAETDDGSLAMITFMDPKLYVAAADGHIHVFEQYDDVHVQLTPKKNTVLHVAAQFGQADCVHWILQLPSLSFLLQQPNEKGDTPLHLAAREGHLTVVKNLIHAAEQLQKGDSERGGTAYCKELLRMTNKVKDTALHEAVRNHHAEVVKLLIQEDPEFTYGANDEGNTPLYMAAERGFGDLVQMILDICSSPADSGFKGRTALHAAVILNDRAMTKKILEWKPALTKELDENGWSPLHFAAYVGCHPTIVRQLLEIPDTDRYVVYLGVEDHGIGNRTALHIAASRGHVGIVKELVSHFPDCCEKVDDKGNNVVHLIMLKKGTFEFPCLSNIRWLRVRGLTDEKNGDGKTPLDLFHNSSSFITLETMFAWIFAIIFLMCGSRSSRPSGSLEIKKESDNNQSKESKEISEIRKTIKTHMIVAALIATVTFAAGFTLPGGYIQDKGDNQGMAVLSLPTNRTKDQDGLIATAVRRSFKAFVVEDSIALVLSLSAIGIYFLAAFPTDHKISLLSYLFYGYLLTVAAMFTMVIAFVDGLQAVLRHSKFLEESTGFIYPVFYLLFMGPCIFIMVPNIAMTFFRLVSLRKMRVKA